MKFIDEELRDLKQIKTDKLRLQQVLQNLISNAVHFSKDKNDIDIVASYNFRDQQLQIAVRDYKVDAISDREQESLFRRAIKLQYGEKQNPTGSGMGLYISKLLMKQINGKLEFERNSGSLPGSTFKLTLDCPNDFN